MDIKHEWDEIERLEQVIRDLPLHADDIKRPDLEQILAQLRAQAEQQAAQENQRRAEQEAAESKRLQERHEDYANAERRYRTQNKIAIIMPLVTFILGLLVEHWSGVVARVLSLFH